MKGAKTCPFYSGFRFTGAQFQSASRGPSPVDRPINTGFWFKGIYLYITKPSGVQKPIAIAKVCRSGQTAQTNEAVFAETSAQTYR